MLRSLLTGMAIFFVCGALTAQSKAETLAIDHLTQKAEQATYTTQDLRDLAVDYSYTDQKVGLSYVYLNQQIGTIPIRHATATVTIKDDRVLHTASRFIADIESRVTSVVPKLNDSEAMQAAAASIGESMPATASRAETATGPQGQRMYTKTAFALHPLEVADYYILGDDGKLRRAIGVTIDHKASSNRYEMSVDAVTGEILETTNHTIRCQFDHDFLGVQITGDCDVVPAKSFAPTVTSAPLNDGSSYRVFPWPAESPIHGTHTLVTNPADSNASPFGWHDTDGADGAEFTITRGNNTHAYLDALDDDSPSEAEPDGGSTLTFDFPYDVDAEPQSQSLTTVTNLFYAVNQIHDFSFQYGFDEVAGNFQQNNYSGEGRGNDHVQSQSQDGAATGPLGPDADHINNANFSTPADGGGGRMQMYLWDANNQGNAIVGATPSQVEDRTFGDLGLTGAGWSPMASLQPTTNIIAGVQDVVDNTANVSLNDGCETIVNAADIAGKIALVDRGTCEFSRKAVNAQRAGAVAVIICNFEDPAAGMAGGADGDDVTVPTFMLPLSGCQTIRALAAQYSDFQLKIAPPASSPTTYVAGSFDNGIIAHEFGHGISTRLTGGPNTSCLGSDEQMGEGWSDFFTLVTSAKTGDVGITPRGIGTYAQRETIDGPGIRPNPYSTDMFVNPVTYTQVADGAYSMPHGIGSIWCSMLWDLYWNMVDVHGWDDDQFYGDGGNNRAIRLVMQGMKIQPCNPGFADGRDAIIAADEALYAGENSKLIWQTFARRGLGADADQGDPNDRFDGVAGFTIPNEIADTVYFSKSMSSEVANGGVLDVQIIIANWLDNPVPTATLQDILPAGSSINATSVNQPYTQSGDVLNFTFENLTKGDSVTINYSVTLNNDRSLLLYDQPILSDNEENDWESENLDEDDSDEPVFWEVVETGGFDDDATWMIAGTSADNNSYFAMTEELAMTITGDNPMVSFRTKYDLSPSAEGGIVEYFDESESRWVVIPQDLMRRNGYTTSLPYQTFVIPFLDGYAGNSGQDWRRVLIDMSGFAGQDIRLRWRYGRDSGNAAISGEGWSVDDIQLIDAITHNTTATLNIAQIGELTARGANIGTLVTPDAVVDISEATQGAGQLTAFPNPTSGEVTFLWQGTNMAAGTIDVYNATGQRLNSVAIGAGDSRLIVNLANQAAGLYTAHVRRGNAEQTVRIVKR